MAENVERNSFIANVNLLVRQLGLLEDVNDKFSDEDVAALTKLSAFDLDVLIDDLSKGSYLGSRKLDINLLYNVVGYNKNLTNDELQALWSNSANRPAYTKATFTLTTTEVIDVTLSSITTSIDLYNALVGSPVLTNALEGTNILLEADPIIGYAIRIVDGDIPSNVQSVVLHTASNTAIRLQSPYNWFTTSSSLEIIAANIRSLLEILVKYDEFKAFDENFKVIVDNMDDLNVIVDNMDALLDLYDALDDVSEALNVKYTYLDTMNFTRTIGGITEVSKSVLAANGVGVISPNKSVFSDTAGTLAVYINDKDVDTVNLRTVTISPISGDHPTLLGNVPTYAALPKTVAQALVTFRRTPSVDDYARVLNDETNNGYTVEYYLSAIVSGNITWGNPVVINTADYQSQTTLADNGKVLTGGSVVGTFGSSIGVDAAPVASSQNLVRSGGVAEAFNITLTDANASTTLPFTAKESITAKIQALRNNVKALFANALGIGGNPSKLSYGSTGTEGVSPTAARSDHTHTLDQIADVHQQKTTTADASKLLTGGTTAGTFGTSVDPATLEKVSNKTLALSAASTDAQYASAKAIFTALSGKVDKTSVAKRIYGTDSEGNAFLYDADALGGTISDVKVDGTSVVTDGVANVDLSGKVAKVVTADRVYGTDSSGNATTFPKDSFGKVDDVKFKGVSVVTDKVANIPEGAKILQLSGLNLTRVLNGVTNVPKSSFPGTTEFEVGKLIITDAQGTLGIYITDVDANTLLIQTRSISPMSGEKSTLLGTVPTRADLPNNTVAAESLFGRTPVVDDYCRITADEAHAGATTKIYIVSVEGGVITWGNEVVLNAADYQAQTTTTDAGKLLTGGATPGTFGPSVDRSTLEITSNKVLDITDSSTDAQYPSAKAVNTKLKGKVSVTTEADKLYGTDEDGNPTTFDLSAVGGDGKVKDVTVNGTSVLNETTGVAAIDLSGLASNSALQSLSNTVDGKVEKTTAVDSVYGTDAAGQPTTYPKSSFGAVNDVKVNGTSVVTNRTANVSVPSTASQLSYDNTQTTENPLTSTDTQDAIDTIIARINLTNNNLDDLATDVSGIQMLYLTGSTLTRVLGGTTNIARSVFAANAAFKINKVLLSDVNGTFAVYTSNADAETLVFTTRTITHIAQNEPTLLGNVATRATLPSTVTAATARFGRSVEVDDYCRVLADEGHSGATTEIYITNIVGDAITWGNEIILNTSDYQAQTTAGDSGKVLVGGSTPGTYGPSKSFDATPTTGSTNLVTSGAIASAITTAVTNGNVSSASKLTTARTFQTDLASTTATSFDGTANNTHGVTGVLPVANGGTGASTVQDALANLNVNSFLTQAQYDALSDTDKNNGTTYFIYE